MFYMRTDLVIGAQAPLLVTEEFDNLGESQCPSCYGMMIKTSMMYVVDDDYDNVYYMIIDVYR